MELNFRFLSLILLKKITVRLNAEQPESSGTSDFFLGIVFNMIQEPHEIVFKSVHVPMNIFCESLKKAQNDQFSNLLTLLPKF